jgi:Tfp pilus assembly protein PilV
MVAMMITLVGLLGLLASVNIATEHNLRNASRNEAMQIADGYLNQLLVNPFTNISTSFAAPGSASLYNYAPVRVQSRLRGVSANFTVLRTATALTSSSALLTVTVQWTYKNIPTSQGLQTVRSQ